MFDKLWSGDKEDGQNTEKSNSSPDYKMIASPNVRFIGSIHSSGEAYVTVDTQYGEREGAIDIRGSIHGTGYQDFTVRNRCGLRDELLELPDSASGFSNFVSDRLRFTEQSNVTINKLAIIPPDPRVIIAMANEGFDVYEEIEFVGSVHSVGTISANIKELYMY